MQESRPDHPVIKANPMPDFSKVFVPITSHKATEVVPFTFEERYQSKPSLVQQILEKEKEKENVSSIACLTFGSLLCLFIHRDHLRPIHCHPSPLHPSLQKQ